MTWEVWALIIVVALAIGAWWVKRAVAGMRRTVGLGQNMLDEVRRLDKARQGETGPPPDQGSR
jgi:hypothetical protein